MTKDDEAMVRATTRAKANAVVTSAQDPRIGLDVSCRPPCSVKRLKTPAKHATSKEIGKHQSL